MGKHKTEKEISTLSGPDKWVVNNSRTRKETECSIKGGETTYDTPQCIGMCSIEEE